MAYLGAVIHLNNKYCIRYSRSLYGFPLRPNTALCIRTSSGGWENGILGYNPDADDWYIDGISCSVLEGLIVKTETII